MIAKVALFEQYCLIEEIIMELNTVLLNHLRQASPSRFLPDSIFIAQVVMVRQMMLYFLQGLEQNDWIDEFAALYQRTRQHLFTIEMMLEDLISTANEWEV